MEGSRLLLINRATQTNFLITKLKDEDEVIGGIKYGSPVEAHKTGVSLISGSGEVGARKSEYDCTSHLVGSADAQTGS